MSTRTKKGYFWAFDQQDKWDDIVIEKIAQLDEITNTHIDWFEKHSSVSDLISWKRPLIDLKRTKKLDPADSFHLQDNSIEQYEETGTLESNWKLDNVQTHSNKFTTTEAQHDTRIEMNMMSNQVKSPKHSVISKSIKERDTNEKVASPLSLPVEIGNNQPANDNDQLTTNLPDLVANVGSQTTNNSNSQNEPSTPEQYHSIPLSHQEYNEHEDEIRLVVSTRNYQSEVKEQQQQQEAAKNTSSPIKSPCQSMTFAPTLNRHQSSFMSRLFELERYSTSKNDSKKDSPLLPPTDMITTKRPSLNSIKSENILIPAVGSIVARDQSTQDIQVSNCIPANGPRFKRAKLDVTSSVKSTTSSDTTIPKPTSTSGDTDRKEADNEPTQEEEEFKIPAWATGPELILNLQRQSELNPDGIFGRIQPIQIQEIFPNLQKYTEIPEQAPE